MPLSNPHEHCRAITGFTLLCTPTRCVLILDISASGPGSFVLDQFGSIYHIVVALICID